MSVAVAAFSPALKEYNRTTLPQPDLLDALLASCKKPEIVSGYSGYGRELKPYFDTRKTAASRQPLAKSREKSATPKTHKPRALGDSTAQVAGAKKSTHHKTPVSRKLTAAQNDMKSPPLPTALSSWAGPGFCVSPTPDKVPLPTAALLL